MQQICYNFFFFDHSIGFFPKDKSRKKTRKGSGIKNGPCGEKKEISQVINLNSSAIDDNKITNLSSKIEKSDNISQV